MYIPSATYRIQFNSDFKFEAAREVAAYLKELGVSTLYAAPIFKARKGSRHGYDVVDPNQINPEVGTAADFEALIDTLHGHRMGWVQDFVPNHMAYTSDNLLLVDIFEKGPGSPYFGFFDVVWDHLRENLRGKLIAPFLGGPFGETLEKGEIELHYDGQAFSISYYETRYPIRIESYAAIISHRLDEMRERRGEDDADFLKLVGITHVLENLRDEQESEARNSQMALARDSLAGLYQENEHIRAFIDENVSLFNSDFDLLDALLAEQWFRLTYWRVATKEINYQRFFNINELISLRMEDAEVFEFIHRFALGLLAEGKIDGLRIDHVDGLYDPTSYLLHLRKEATDAFIVVEKILELNEQLPADWPVQGTTGYEFLNYLNGLFVDGRNEQAFERIYKNFAGESYDYSELLYEKKKLIIERHLAGDLDNLTYVLKKISITTRHGIDLTWVGLKTALAELSAFFPVYRTYTVGYATSEQDRGYIERAIEKAKTRNADLARELDFIEKVLWMEMPGNLSDEHKRLWLSFVMRFQQFTSPLMAKGLEDTTFYVYNRLVSLNEVGGDPGRFGISVTDFHEFSRRRAEHFPHTLNATATHDTKRGEDVRARIDVLSEMPEEWEQHLKLWHDQNRQYKRTVGGEESPDNNREYFLYQTLIGALPFDETERAGFAGRIKEYIIKSAREAKTHTFWLDNNAEYEDALLAFTEAILTPGDSNHFLESFTRFQKRVARYGMLNSLAQAVMKITAPGLPDFYQGTELWDLSLVDPDNRRAVDYEKRERYLREINERESSGPLDLIEELLSTREDGRVKLFTIARALRARNRDKELFDGGSYDALEVTGDESSHLIAFARQAEDRAAVVVAPRLLVSLVAADRLPLGEVWRETKVTLPGGRAARWRNVFTGQVVEGAGWVMAAELFRHFPVCFLIRI